MKVQSGKLKLTSVQTRRSVVIFQLNIYWCRHLACILEYLLIWLFLRMIQTPQPPSTSTGQSWRHQDWANHLLLPSAARTSGVLVNTSRTPKPRPRACWEPSGLSDKDTSSRTTTVLGSRSDVWKYSTCGRDMWNGRDISNHEASHCWLKTQVGFDLTACLRYTSTLHFCSCSQLGSHYGVIENNSILWCQKTLFMYNIPSLFMPKFN